MNTLEIIAILSSSLSLIIAFIALYKSVIKRGKIKFYVYSHPDNVNVLVGTRTNDIPTSLHILMSVRVKNIGANPVTIRNIYWEVPSTSGLKTIVFDYPKFYDNNNYFLLAPYEQQSGVLQIEFIMDGFEQPYNDEYYELVHELSGKVINEKHKIALTYEKYGLHKIKLCKKEIDITKIIHNQYKKYR